MWRQRAGRDEEKVHKNTFPKICVIYSIIQEVKFVIKLMGLFAFIPIMRTQKPIGNEKLVIWDYHVIFVYKPDERRCLVFDLDSDLPFPTFFHKVIPLRNTY